MQCTCVRCYNFYHPAPPSIYASLTLLSKSRLPYPSIHLSMPVPPLVQVSAALTIHTSIHPSIHPPTHTSIYPCLSPPCPSLISPIHPCLSHPNVPVSSPRSIHPSMPLLPPCPSPISPIHPCLSHSPCQVFTILYICLTLGFLVPCSTSRNRRGWFQRELYGKCHRIASCREHRVWGTYNEVNLTNKSASSVLRSELSTQQVTWARKKCREKREPQASVFPVCVNLLESMASQFFHFAGRLKQLVVQSIKTIKMILSRSRAKSMRL